MRERDVLLTLLNYVAGHRRPGLKSSGQLGRAHFVHSTRFIDHSLDGWIRRCENKSVLIILAMWKRINLTRRSYPSPATAQLLS